MIVVLLIATALGPLDHTIMSLLRSVCGAPKLEVEDVALAQCWFVGNGGNSRYARGTYRQPACLQGTGDVARLQTAVLGIFIKAPVSFGCTVMSQPHSNW